MGDATRKRRLLYIGLAHRAQDTRLCRLLADAVERRYPDVECLYLGVDSNDPIANSNRVMRVIPMPDGLKSTKPWFSPRDIDIMARYIRDLPVDLVQISDVRELTLGYRLKKHTTIPVIFDSHEDYFNQKYEYAKKSPFGLLRGTIARTQEILFIRYMDAVFCTDDFLNGFYKYPIFDAESVAMVRNIPRRTMIREKPIIHERGCLDLVYIGTVNAMRGVIETAEYCARFNAESKAEGDSFRISFHVFSNPGAIVSRLVKENKIVFHGFLQGTALEEAVSAFDIGVSLILPMKKYQRNIPIKNFEYMALGLPILTGNFGPMRKYVGDAGAGVLIDPLDYSQFREAVLRFKDPDFRRTCGERGIAYAREHFDREREVRPYIETVGRLLHLQGDPDEVAPPAS